MIRRVTMTDDPPAPKKAKKGKAKSAKPKLPGRSPVAKDAECDFNQLIVRAADCVHELRRLSQSPKLSCNAFQRDALLLSGKTEDQLSAIGDRINRGPGTESAAGFVHRLARALASPNYPSIPTNKMSKLLWQFGSEDTLAALGNAGASLADGVALAALAAVARWPENFGSVDCAETYRARIDGLQERITKLYALMKRRYTADDTLVESRSLSPHDRARGLVVVRLKRHPSIHMGLDDWPRLLTEAALAAQGGVPQEPEPKLSPETRDQILNMASGVVVMQQSAMSER